VFSACVAAVKSRPVLHHCVVIFPGPQGSWSVHVCCLHLKIECARGRQWCGIIHNYGWTASLKLVLLCYSYYDKTGFIYLHLYHKNIIAYIFYKLREQLCEMSFFSTQKCYNLSAMMNATLLSRRSRSHYIVRQGGGAELWVVCPPGEQTHLADCCTVGICRSNGVVNTW